MSGMLITFEGIEGCGKTTQIEKAEAFLKGQGIPVLRTFEPGATNVGKQIRQILLHHDSNARLHHICELLLFEADRAQHVSEVILPALNNNLIVLCDRYFDSTTAYQGGGRELDLDMVLALHRIASLGVIPTRTYLLDVPVTVGLQRIRKRNQTLDRLESETVEFHERIRNLFLRLAKQEPDRILLIDGTLPEEQVAMIIQQDLVRLISLR